jgi:hypothetical protein
LLAYSSEGEAEAEPAAPEAEPEPEVKEMTLDEYRASLNQTKPKAEFNIRYLFPGQIEDLLSHER